MSSELVCSIVEVCSSNWVGSVVEGHEAALRRKEGIERKIEEDLKKYEERHSFHLLEGSFAPFPRRYAGNLKSHPCYVKTDGCM